MNQTLLLVVLMAPCPDAQRPAFEAAVGSRTVDGLWAAEAALRAAGPCEPVTGAATPEAQPRAVSTPVLLPAQPAGPGTGPWVMLGVAAALGAGVAYVDFAANDARDALEASQKSGDSRAFADARDDLETHQFIARGLAVGAGVAALSGLIWLATGGDSDPVQPRPYFTPTGAGWGLDF
jgi:hypothetical protein